MRLFFYSFVFYLLARCNDLTLLERNTKPTDSKQAVATVIYQKSYGAIEMPTTAIVWDTRREQHNRPGKKTKFPSELKEKSSERRFRSYQVMNHSV